MQKVEKFQDWGSANQLEDPQTNYKVDKLTGWRLTKPLWKIWKSIGMIIPNILENKKYSKPPTSIPILPVRIQVEVGKKDIIRKIAHFEGLNWSSKPDDWQGSSDSGTCLAGNDEQFANLKMAQSK